MLAADGVEIRCFPDLPMPQMSRNLGVAERRPKRQAGAAKRWHRFCAWYDAQERVTVADAMASGTLTIADVQWELDTGELVYSD